MNPAYHAETNKWPVQNGLTGGVTGVVRVASGDSPEGVGVQLVAPNGVRTTVYANADGNVTITMKWKDDHQPRNCNLGGRHTLLIPARYNLDVRTAGGGIRGEDIDGRVLARTSGGGIRFDNVNGAVEVDTSGGGIRLGNVNGAVDAHTSGGGITLGHIKGDARVETSGGGIVVEEVTGELHGSTSGGSIRAALANQIQKPLALSTSGGSIRLTVPADFKADLRASTSGGSVDCGLPVEGSVKHQSIKGKINGGGPEVRLSTSGGSIELAKR